MLFGKSSDGSAHICQLVRLDSKNCKTFMRRFDPDPRLQSFSTTYFQGFWVWLPFGCQSTAVTFSVLA